MIKDFSKVLEIDLPKKTAMEYETFKEMAKMKVNRFKSKFAPDTSNH